MSQFTFESCPRIYRMCSHILLDFTEFTFSSILCRVHKMNALWGGCACLYVVFPELLNEFQ